MTNGALRANPNTFEGGADDNITSAYSDWYFTVCAIMGASSLAFLFLSSRKPRRDRIFHYITASVTVTAALAYWTMGSNLGYVPIDVEFRGPGTRAIFYVRYIDWVITTPLLLMDLLLTAGTPWPTILFVIFADEVMIVTGLVGALVQSSYKWGYFFVAMLALFYIIYHLTFESLRNSRKYGEDVRGVFLRCGALTSFLWLLYPLAWGLCEGGNMIDTNSEAIFYGILDVFAKPVFGALLLHGHRNIDPARLGIHIADYEVVDPHEHNRQAAKDNAAHGTRPGDSIPANSAEVHHNPAHDSTIEPKPETTV